MPSWGLHILAHFPRGGSRTVLTMGVTRSDGCPFWVQEVKKWVGCAFISLSFLSHQWETKESEHLVGGAATDGESLASWIPLWKTTCWTTFWTFTWSKKLTSIVWNHNILLLQQLSLITDTESVLNKYFLNEWVGGIERQYVSLH